MGNDLDSQIGLIAETIRVERARKRLTRGGLAQACGVSSQSIRNYEDGATVPNLANLAKIAEVLGFDWRLFFRDPSNKLNG